MSLDVEATYECGTLKLPGELPLQEGQKVRITIHAPGNAVERLYGMLKWSGSQDDLDYLLGPDNQPGSRIHLMDRHAR
jgi:predicted DNA-binding antitoxin AbrB/MazE fold protein